MRGSLGLFGIVALIFGLGTFHATDKLGLFAASNFILAILALGASLISTLPRWQRGGNKGLFPEITRGVVRVTCVLLIGFMAMWLTTQIHLRFDWSYGKSFELAPATIASLKILSDPVRATLFIDPRDPRLRQTRALLRSLEATGQVKISERSLSLDARYAKLLGVESSNTIVLEMADRIELVERPIEGTVFEAIARLAREDLEPRLLIALTGAGEGSTSERGPAGFSGLKSALALEGYIVEEHVGALGGTPPMQMAGILLIDPQRAYNPAAVASIDSFLSKGGRLIVLLEPGIRSGLEELLERWGLSTPNKWVGDPQTNTPETGPLVVSRFSPHPITKALGGGRFAYLPGTRAIKPWKPSPEDQVTGVAFSGISGWLSKKELRGPSPPPPSTGIPRDFYAVVAAGRYIRGEREARIVAFGDSEFASNRYLRALYNLDLVMNAVHWATSRPSQMTLRPKTQLAGGTQRPIPASNAFFGFFAIGLLVPELLLFCAIAMWVRQRPS